MSVHGESSMVGWAGEDIRAVGGRIAALWPGFQSGCRLLCWGGSVMIPVMIERIESSVRR
jgi:hypothetical protein